MESIIRNVRDIDTDERHLLERVIGQHLQENQQLVIRIVTVTTAPADEREALEPKEDDKPCKLPPWCNVYEGLSDSSVADLEKVILERADLTRPFE